MKWHEPECTMRLDRRKVVATAAVTAAGGMVMQQRIVALNNSPSMMLVDSGVRTLTHQLTAMTPNVDPRQVRADITAGRAGIPTRVRIQVVDAMGRPLPGTRIDIWHFNADRRNSNHTGPGKDRQTSTMGENWFCGTQFGDENALVEFDTVYPHWHPGRSTHIHFKIILNPNTALTGRILFPDALSKFICEDIAAPGARATPRATFNTLDDVVWRAAPASGAELGKDKGGNRPTPMMDVSYSGFSTPGGGMIRGGAATTSSPFPAGGSQHYAH